MEIEVVIIGTGTAALAAAKEVAKVTNRFVIISNGVYGTTCVRAGCMPSKAFIRGAQAFAARKRMGRWGIEQTEALTLRLPQLLAQVRTLREHFLRAAIQTTETFRPHIVEADARFLSPDMIQAGNVTYHAKSVILATGSSPVMPQTGQTASSHILTSDTLFEQDDISSSIGVLGMSVLGAEFAQAFAFSGIRVTAQHDSALIGGLTDPEVSACAVSILREQMELRLNDSSCFSPSTLFAAQGRKANLENMGLEECGLIRKGEPVLDYDPQTMQVGELPIFVAGDVKAGRSILNEAVHEGEIAGYNATHQVKAFKRRTPLQIVHTEPVMAIAGQSFEELSQAEVLTGVVSFEDQGCAKILGQNKGLLKIYADKHTHILLGAEMLAPGGEHLAHQLAWLIDRGVTVMTALELPFYHPSLEEGLKTALSDLRP